MPTHPDGFNLMKYRSDDGVDEEWIWNSRAGITPFIATLSNGKTAMHQDWAQDKHLPDYVPPLGSIVFIDATKERLQARAVSFVERHWNDSKYPMCDMFEGQDKAAAVEKFLEEWIGDGEQPMQITVDETFLAELVDARKNRN